MEKADYVVDDFAYDGACDSAGLPARVALFADSQSTRTLVTQDLAGAGFRTVDGGEVANLLDGPITLLGDVVMVDCPVVDAKAMAALARLDMRVARAGAQLIVATSMAALDLVFSALDQSQAQILVEPSRAERIVAVGRILADVSHARVREMSEEDRLSLLRLSQQVDAIAQQLDRISLPADGSAQNLNNTAHRGSGGTQPVAKGGQSPIRPAHAALPDPGVVRRIIAARQARAKFFEIELFADPAWDMLLDLTAAHGEHAHGSVTSLCIASGVPATTALRWIRQLVESGVFERIEDSSDKRRAFIALSQSSLVAMGRYFAEVEEPLARAA